MSTPEKKYLDYWHEQEKGLRPRDIVVKDIRMELIESVFNPEENITHSTSMMLNHVPDVEGKSVMDLGVGSGVLAIYCAYKGASTVLGTDISDYALQNSNINVRRHRFENSINLRESFLFRRVNERFDIVLANLPIISSSEQTTSYSELLEDLPDHLKIGGKLYLTQASFGNPNGLEDCIRSHGLDYEHVTTMRLGVQWDLFIVSV